MPAKTAPTHKIIPKPILNPLPPLIACDSHVRPVVAGLRPWVSSHRRPTPGTAEGSLRVEPDKTHPPQTHAQTLPKGGYIQIFTILFQTIE